MASSLVARPETPSQTKASTTAAPTTRLSHRAIWGTLWTVFGFGFNQGIRLASSLVVTRLLAPDAFGMMALVVVFLIGVELLSDVGLRGSVIHHERGDCPDFLDTVWTIQVIRGFALWLVCVAIAYPVSIFYQTPELAQLLPVAALTAVIRGFASTHIYTVNRHLSPPLVDRRSGCIPNRGGHGHDCRCLLHPIGMGTRIRRLKHGTHPYLVIALYE